MAQTSLEKVEEAERTVFQDLYARFDRDKKLTEEKYELQDADGEKIPGAISVTMNDAAIFLNAVISWIIGAKWQTVVEGNLSGTQQHYIEGFLEDKDAQMDERLAKTEYGMLLAFMASHICERGWIVQRRIWLNDKKTGEPYLDVLPADMRHISYERGTDNFNWVSNRELRLNSKIKAEYDITIYGAGSETEVVDWWSGEKEEVWINKVLVPATKDRPMPNKHKIGYPPWVIAAAPEGFMMLDKGYMVRKGESIFFLNRDLYPEWNRIISIDQSLAMQALAPPYQKEVEEGESKSPYPNEPATVYDLPNEKKYELVERPDINRANQTAELQISGGQQRGGVNNIDLGNLQQNTTAIWITEQTEIRNKIITPRLKAIEDAKQQASRMDIDQFQKGKFNTTIGQMGKQTQYVASQLGDPKTYIIRYEGMSRSKKQEIANMALFNASSALSLKTRLTDILLVDDPEGEMTRIDNDRAEEADPVLFYMRKARSLAREAAELKGIDAEAKKMESKRLTQKGVELLRMGTTGQQEIPRPKSNSNMLLPLLAGNQGGRGVA